MKEIVTGLAVTAALIAGGVYYFTSTEGFSGTSENGNSVVETHKGFTGSQVGTPTIVTGIEGPTKSGFSGGTKEVAISHKEFTGSHKVLLTPKIKQVDPVGMQVPTIDTPKVVQQTPQVVIPVPTKQEIPTIDTDKALNRITKDVQKVEEELKVLETARSR
jgi:hypothetical protein